MVDVTMLVQTRFECQNRNIGDVLSVDEDIAMRWVDNGIAVYTEVAEEQPDYTKKTAKELYELCIEQGFEDVKAKQSKEYYIEMLLG